MPDETSGPCSLDTTPEAQHAFDRIVREMPEMKHSHRFFEVNRFAREQGISGHMSRDPSLTRRQAYLKIVRDNPGDDVFNEVHS